LAFVLGWSTGKSVVDVGSSDDDEMAIAELIAYCLDRDAKDAKSKVTCLKVPFARSVCRAEMAEENEASEIAGSIHQ
jgi:hypothetical protein